MRNKTHLLSLSTLAFAAVLSTAAQSPAQTKPLTDAQIESDVLKAFAGESRLANEPITTSTVYGTVTLSGSVSTEAARDKAEQIASRTAGVKKVVDQLVVGAPQAASSTGDPAAANSYPMQGDAGPQTAVAAGRPAYPGQYPPAEQYPQQNAQGQPPYPPTGAPYGDAGNTPPQPYGPPQGYGAQQPYGQPKGAYPDAQNGYPPPPPRRLYRRDYERQMSQGAPGQGYAAPQGQPGGAHVVVPGGSTLSVSINRWISSGDAAPGSTFTALVANDVLAEGQIAVPRGATVEGTVIDAKGAGALKGRGSLTLQLNTLLLGGQRIPLGSDPFTVTGHDKAARSVNSTIIGAGLGALFGAAVGRGTGAAIGAGVGGAAGLGSAAASNGGQATLPPEALLNFRLTAPVPLVTVSEAEMQRLGGYAGPAVRRGPPYGDPYYRGYYRGPYGY